MKTNLSRLGILAAVVAVIGLCAGWVTEPRDAQFNGKIEARQNLNIAGGWSIGGTNVGATADQINGILTNLNATAAEINGAVDISARTLAVVATNGAPITLSSTYTVYALSGEGQAANSTNTVNFVQPFPLGLTAILYSKTTSTNYVVMWDSTTTNALAGDVTLSARDACMIHVVATNLLVLVSKSDND